MHGVCRHTAKVCPTQVKQVSLSDSLTLEDTWSQKYAPKSYCLKCRFHLCHLPSFNVHCGHFDRFSRKHSEIVSSHTNSHARSVGCDMFAQDCFVLGMMVAGTVMVISSFTVVREQLLSKVSAIHCSVLNNPTRWRSDSDQSLQ